ncbi:hypothetical protein PL373_13235 [Tenacibaculum maritimum]|nr:hypothetical protein [Tenacibaculum maritimum]MDB0600311.1 hypothetical protein [Tenacibaculum maritimum]MDB0602092.1 hypothetical protein [Tenacibaculum maritimum]MDB0610821.1 hypothetical protein [Tenacibaculum maritimum]
MMSFTGFSTTSDLNQNSDAVTISDYDVGDQVTAIIVVKSDLNVTLDKIEFIDVRYTETLNQDGLSNEAEKLETALKEQMIPPLILFSRKDRIDYKPPLQDNYKDVFAYRRARDGISCNLS